MNREKLDKTLQLVDEALQREGLGYRCIETEWCQADKTLSIYIDINDSGSKKAVLIEDCVVVTKLLKSNQEFDNLLTTQCHFEVSSPGLERPLRLDNDFAAFVGQRVDVRVREPVEGKRKLVGQLVSVDKINSIYGVQSDDGTWRFALSNLQRAKTIYDWTT